MIKPIETSATLNITREEIEILQHEISCPVSLEPLEEGVVLIPCTHRIQQSVAEFLFGERNAEFCTNKGETCPLCTHIVTGYMIDEGMRALVEKVSPLLARLKTAENISPTSINLQEIAGIEATLHCPLSLELLNQASILVPCGHRIHKLIAHDLFGTIVGDYCEKQEKECYVCELIVTSYLFDEGTAKLMTKLSSLLEKLKKITKATPTTIEKLRIMTQVIPTIVAAKESSPVEPSLPSYAPQSPLGKLYHAIMSKASLENQKKHFFELDIEVQNDIYELIWRKAGEPQGEWGWGQKHGFDNIDYFELAVYDWISNQFDHLSPDQKNGVYEKVYILAGRPDTTDREWGKNHAKENLPRLCDALALIKN